MSLTTAFATQHPAHRAVTTALLGRGGAEGSAGGRAGGRPSGGTGTNHLARCTIFKINIFFSILCFMTAAEIRFI